MAFLMGLMFGFFIGVAASESIRKWLKEKW
jgi:hypothetical protein